MLKQLIQNRINTIYNMDSPDDAIRAVTEVDSLLTSLEELLDNEPCTDSLADSLIDDLKHCVLDAKDYLSGLDIEDNFKEMAQESREYDNQDDYKQQLFNRR